MGRRTYTWKKKFIPTDIAGCVLWLRSDLGITKNGSNLVSLWEDQSGVGNHFSQDTPDKKPTYYDNQIDGYPDLFFDGIDDYLRCDSIVHNQPISVFMVIKGHVFPSYGEIYCSRYANTFALRCFPSLQIYIYAPSFGPSQLVSLETYYFLSMIYDGTSSIFHKNGGNETTGDVGSAGTDLGLVLGGAIDQHWVSFSTPELIFYNNRPSPGDIIKIENYAATRYPSIP